MSTGTDIQVLVRHPSEAFIKFLITQPHKDAEDDKWVRYEVASRGFPNPDELYIAAIRTQLMANIPGDFSPDLFPGRACSRAKEPNLGMQQNLRSIPDKWKFHGLRNPCSLGRSY